MKTIDRRLSKLENDLGLCTPRQHNVVVLMDAESELGTAQETYIKMLQETGSLHAGVFSVVDLTHTPDGLNAEETARLVRENGDKISGSRSTQGPVLNVVLDQAYNT